MKVDDDDYRELIKTLAAELRASGAPGIAEERHYAEPDPETGEPRLFSPQRRLIAMLEAFERHLAIRDRATYEFAIGGIRDSVQGPAPERITVIFTADADEGSEISLHDAPDLEGVRTNVRDLIRRLRDGDLRPNGGDVV